MRAAILVSLLVVFPASGHTLPALENGTFDKDIWPWAITNEQSGSFDWRMAEDANGSSASRSAEIGIQASAAADSSFMYECLSVDAARLYDAGARAFIPLDQRFSETGARLVLRWYGNSECSGAPISSSLSSSAEKAGVWVDLLLRKQPVPSGATHVAFVLEMIRTYRQGPASRVRFDDAYFAAVGDRVTIPAVASLRGAAGSDWSSDLHLVNQSGGSLKATLLYRCLAGPTCNLRPRELTLPPGDSIVIKDVANTLFESPSSGGAIEILSAAGSGQLIATSRLNSRAPRGTYGADVPAVSEANYAIGTVFPGVRNGPDFRTNLGIYNPQDRFIEVSISLFVDGKEVAQVILMKVEARTLVQMNVFAFLQVPEIVTDNAYIRIGTRHGPVVPFVSVIDNATNDVAFSTGIKQF